jgi:tetratricopeptide (TPR) repeat protein
VLDYPRDKSEEIAYVDKLILGGYYEQTIDMLKGRVNDTTNVINAQRIFYLGMAHYNLNNFAEALENFIKAFNLQINGAGN